jgi:hypothetical protein
MKKKPITAGAKEGLGAGIVLLGIMLVLMPSMAEKISALVDWGVTGSPYAILTGSAFVIGGLVILAGIAVIFVRSEEETGEDE